MRRLLLGLSVLCAVAALAGTARAADRSVSASAVVEALGATGRDVSFATVGTGGLCGQVTLWSTAARVTAAFPRTPTLCPQTSTGTGIAGAESSGGRVLWLSYTGGNTREWSLYTATTSARKGRLLRFVARDVDGPPGIVLGRADEESLPYAVDAQVVVLGPNGARRYAWTAPGRVAALSAGFHRVAVLLETGDVYVLAATGAVLAHYSDYAAGDVHAIRYGSLGVVLELDDQIELRRTGVRDDFPLPAGGHLVDYANGVVAYARGGDVRAIRVADGEDVVVRSPGRPFLARLARRGLAIARGRTVSWVPWPEVAGRFS
jgi:hypothetical protein